MDFDLLNSQQKEAVKTVSGPLLILAGPGTGKTRVIIQKISYLLELGTKPEKILAMTFSRKATEEMEERLYASHPETIGRINIQTMHAFSTDLVERHGFRLGFAKNPRMMDDVQANLLFRQVSERLPIQPFVKTSNLTPVLDSLLEFIHSAKDQGLWPEDLLRYTNTLPEENEDQLKIKKEWQALGDLYNALQDFCFQEGYFDFGDAILCSQRILENHPIVREEVQSQYDVILVDEFQDTNWSQIQLLKNLVGPNTHIAAVGDDDQSIYKFRGASYDAFRFFEETFSQTKIVELCETYRLPAPVVSATNALIRANKKRFKPDKRLMSKSKEISPVSLYQFPNFEEEAFYIAEEIESKLQKGASPEEIGILVRAHGHADLFTLEARRRGLPLEATNPETLFDQAVVKDILAYLRLLINPEDSISFSRLLDSPFIDLAGDEIFKLLKWKPLQLEILEKIEESPLEDKSKHKLQHFFKTYQNLIGSSKRIACSELLLDLYEQSNVFDALLHKDEKSLRAVSSFHHHLFEWETAQPHKELPAIFPLLESFSEKGIGFESGETNNRSEKAIKILTTHASKGLEFEHVYILSLVGRRFPGNFHAPTWQIPEALAHDAPMTKGAHLEEERRLLYVGMTRSKKELILSTIQKKGTRPSIFITQDLLQANLSSALALKEFPPLSDDSLFKKIKSKPFERVAIESPPEKANKNRSLKLSFTQLDKYDLCPLKYRFAYDLKIPVASTPALLTGSAVHKALEKFYLDIKSEKEVSEEKLLQYFEKAYEREAEEHGTKRESDIHLAKEHLSTYYKLHEGRFIKPAAIEEPFQLKIGNHLVRGKIDRADKEPGGYRIIDYKTGKAKSDKNTADKKFAKDSLQFSIYALAAKEFLNWDVKALVFYYVYDNTTLSTTRSENDLELTKNKVIQMADDIIHQKFDPKPGHHCQWCEYRKICPAKV